MARGTKENCHGNIMQIPRSEDGKYSNSNQSKLFYFFIQGELAFLYQAAASLCGQKGSLA